MNDPRMIKIFDTTLRDGEQSPGASMNTQEKCEIAKMLVELGVDVIEAGFPIASEGDFQAVKLIADSVQGATICGLARCRDKDIDRAAEALKNAGSARIHVFLATSAIHREFKLRMDKDEIIKRAVASIQQAKGYFDDIEFSPEDASRTEPEFLCDVVEAAIDAGATTINIPDTVGYTVPEKYAQTVHLLKTRVKNIDQAVISVHCHDDLGLAVANSLAAVQAGAGQIECTINGIGERAGNCSLEEVVMAMRTRQDYFKVDTRIQSNLLVRASRMVSNITGLEVQRNKAIVGRNAFAHESGIHQDGMLKNANTYEIMRPEDVGFTQTDLVLGKHSGRAALKNRVQSLGYHLTDDQLQSVFLHFKTLADKKKEIYDSDIASLIEQVMHSVASPLWTWVGYTMNSPEGEIPNSKVVIKRGEEQYETIVPAKDGPLNAIFFAIEELTEIPVVCNEYRVHSVSTGKDAQAESTVVVEHENEIYRGRGVSTDTLEASAISFLNAINQIAYRKANPPKKNKLETKIATKAV
ncbi:2-isopropylmalate synthase [Planctomycetales bacterium 10988]|nr:2-isopropylmalate synthase [Planctomycetales bacterium 10988]